MALNDGGAAFANLKLKRVFDLNKFGVAFPANLTVLLSGC